MRDRRFLSVSDTTPQRPVATSPSDCQHDRLVRALLDSYVEMGGINRIDQTNLPSKRDVALLCEDVLRILFPGFLDEEAIMHAEIEMLTSERIASMTDRLCTQVRRSLRYAGMEGEMEVNREAHDRTCRVLAALPRVRKLLSTDVEAAYEGDPAARSFEEIILAYPSLEAVAIQRLAHELYLLEVPLVPRMMTEWAHSRTGIDIHPGARIGSHFFIDHGTGVVIGETCVIGEWVKLYHGVTLGARSFEKDEEGRIVKGIKRHPNVEDRVTIYPNATVLGGETTIGARSTVGGNVFLMHSVPPDSLVAYEEGGNRILDKTRSGRRSAAAVPAPGSAAASRNPDQSAGTRPGRTSVRSR